MYKESRLAKKIPKAGHVIFFHDVPIDGHLENVRHPITNAP